jgi:hypothetical protein
MIIHSPIISGSLTFANGATFTLPEGGVYSGSFSGSYQGATFTGGTFSGTINSTNGVVSGSSQVSYVGLSNIPAGIVSSSAQIDSLFNLDSVVSGSTQVKNLLPAGSVSGSSQITFSGISSLPTLVSGSSQIDHNSTTNFVANKHIDHTAVSITAGTGLTGGGDISTTRTLAIDTAVTATVTGSQTLTNKTISGASNTLSNIANASLSNSVITIAGTSTSLGGSITLGTITNGSGIFSGSAQVTGLTNTNLSGTAGISNANLANSAITIAGTSTSLGGSITAATILQGTGVVSGSSQVVGSAITTNTITIGSTSTALGGTSTSLAGLTSVTSTGFTGALTGNASTATTLQTARTINGTSFNGSANITIPNLVSGSSQVTLASTTGFGTYIDQALLTTSNVTHNNVTVSGNLTVNGTTTTVNSTTLAIADNVIELNYGGSAVRAGILAKDATGTLTSGSLLWDGTNDYWIGGASGSELPFVTTTGTQTLTNKTISGASNTISNIANASLTNSSVTIGSTAISLGSSATTIAGLTSVTSTGFTGVLTGNASTATTLQTARTINGTSFNGSADITIPNLVSGSSQITAASTTGFATAVKTQLDANTVVSGSAQINVASTTGDIALGTRTSGNYVATITAGTGVSSTGATTGEGIAHTISIGQAVATSSNVQFNSLGIGMAASATAGRIDATNDVVAYSSSDIRFKENVTPIENPLEKISKIGGYTYDWKEENKIEHGYEGNDVGVIAQEIEEVLPQLVQTRESGYKAVKYDKLVALLIEGIKHQQTQIDELTNKINKLENGL